MSLSALFLVEWRVRTPKENTSDFSLYSFDEIDSGLIHLIAPILLLVVE